MTIRQLSVFLENKTGHLNQILNVLSDNDINIVALTVADTSDYGILRAIVSDPVKASEALRNASHTVRIHNIISLEMNPECGSMARIINLFTQADICIEYVYAFNFCNKSILIIRTNDQQKAEELVKTNHLKIMTEEDIK